MSTNTPPPPPQQETNTITGEVPEPGKLFLPFAITGSVFSFLFSMLFSLGAATLSYRRYGSTFWAVIAFLFSPIYYIFYALYLDRPQPTSPNGVQAIMGGLRKLSKRA